MDDKDVQLQELVELLRLCYSNEHQHAVVIFGHDQTRIMNMFAVNADSGEVGRLITAAAAYCIDAASSEPRTLN